MFAITTKVKLAAGIAAGVLTLGAAGAYAAQNLPLTINSPVISQLGGNGAPPLNLVSLTSSAMQLHNPKSLPTNPGECVSFFATNRNYALVPANYDVNAKPLLPITISKANYHGKLMSGLNAWCKAEIKAVSSATTTTTSATVTTNTTQSNDSQSGPPQGHGHGHGKKAGTTD